MRIKVALLAGIVFWGLVSVGLATDVTIYNDDLGLVREKRTFDLKSGVSAVTMDDVAARIDATSVHFASLSDPTGISVLEQNFQYDLVNENKLLEKYLGREIEIERFVGEGKDRREILKGTLLSFYRELFGQQTKLRFRPHFFPFTEPSAEVDVTCPFCKGEGCRICKNTGWLEMGGCGMVDLNVLAGVGYDTEIYTGFAFGLGIDRIAMLRFGIQNIRLLTDCDVRFLRQFSGITPR